MTPDQKRIAIAEYCGWIRGEYHWQDPEGAKWQVMHGWQTFKDGSDILPNYLNDINAINNAVKKHLGNLMVEYVRNLKAIVERDNDLKTVLWFDVITSSASQRAEAFLLTINKN